MSAGLEPASSARIYRTSCMPLEWWHSRGSRTGSDHARQGLEAPRFAIESRKTAVVSIFAVAQPVWKGFVVSVGPDSRSQRRYPRGLACVSRRARSGATIGSSKRSLRMDRGFAMSGEARRGCCRSPSTCSSGRPGQAARPPAYVRASPSCTQVTIGRVSTPARSMFAASFGSSLRASPASRVGKRRCTVRSLPSSSLR